jgi:hypothetical protein
MLYHNYVYGKTSNSDVGPNIQIIADPTGSGSTTLTVVHTTQ